MHIVCKPFGHRRKKLSAAQSQRAGILNFHTVDTLPSAIPPELGIQNFPPRYSFSLSLCLFLFPSAVQSALRSIDSAQSHSVSSGRDGIARLGLIRKK